MRLQKQVSRRVGKTEYSKYVVVLPPEKVKEADWKDGTELEVSVVNNSLVLKTKKR
jgi:antitoxin component of MazEF toxin-antitoxin module